MKLKQIVKETGMSTYKLCSLLGVTRKTLYNWQEKQNYPLWALEKLGYKLKKLPLHREVVVSNERKSNEDHLI